MRLVIIRKNIKCLGLLLRQEEQRKYLLSSDLFSRANPKKVTHNHSRFTHNHSRFTHNHSRLIQVNATDFRVSKQVQVTASTMPSEMIWLIKGSAQHLFTT